MSSALGAGVGGVPVILAYCARYTGMWGPCPCLFQLIAPGWRRR